MDIEIRIYFRIKEEEKLPYYVAALGIYKIEDLLRKKDIDKKYYKIRYHILTMLRLEISKEDCPSFSSKKVINRINSLNYDLDNLELSKDSNFVKKCLSFYK